MYLFNEVLGMEPRPSCMLSTHFTTALSPPPHTEFIHDNIYIRHVVFSWLFFNLSAYLTFSIFA